MFKRNLWKILISVIVVITSARLLLPIEDQPFADYAKTQVTTKAAEFSALIKEADVRAAAKQAPSTYIGLKQIAKERKLDLAAQFFPHLNLGDVKNIERKNGILLEYLLKSSKGKLQLGLDLRGGIGFTLEADPKALTDLPADQRHEKLAKAVEIITNRINSMGLTEPLVRPVGDNRIEVQLPGVNTKDNPEVLDILKKPARLDFRVVMQGTNAMAQDPGEAPPGYEVMLHEEEDKTTGVDQITYFIVKRIPEMTGKNVKNATAHVDEYGRYQIALSFNKEGADEFADVTTRNTGRLLGIVLDGKLYSAPHINEPITGGNASISGSFTQRQAVGLANVLNNPLDVALNVVEQYEVGPSLAQDAISSGVTASIIGTALVAGFMISYYTIGGVVAVVSLAINMLILFGIMGMFHATITMPGLAGIILTVGMAVDANILIFERMRDELNLGKSLKSALVSGYDKAFITIVDAHITQVLICFVMIWLGTGPIKGFGVTLAIGVFSTLFSTLIVSHLLLEWLIEKDIVTKLPMLHLFKNVTTDFVKWGKPAFIASWVIVAIGVGTVIYKGDAINGIDFAGGDVSTVSFTKKLDTTTIRTIATSVGIKELNPSYQTNIGGVVEVLKIETPFGQSDNLINALVKAHPESNFVKIGTTQIGPSIGNEIKLNALISMALSLLVIMVYIAFRFEVGFAIGAVVSTIHDILMTIGIFVILGHQFSAPMVAAILCIAGYSINDTVVVFDRIREELKSNPDMGLRDVINLSIRRVFSRSLMTSVTSFLAALALFIFGGGVIHDLSITFLVGIATGTFSSIFVASPIFFWWHKGDRKQVEKHQDAAPVYEWTGSSKASE